MVASLDRLAGVRHTTLSAALREQRQEMDRYMTALDQAPAPPLALRLSEVNAKDVAEAGGKAAVLGEIHNKLGLPVPPGFVLTTEAYRRYCGIPLWSAIRDAARQVDLNDLKTVETSSRALIEMVLAAPVPPEVERAMLEFAGEPERRALRAHGAGRRLQIDVRA